MGVMRCSAVSLSAMTWFKWKKMWLDRYVVSILVSLILMKWKRRETENVCHLWWLILLQRYHMVNLHLSDLYGCHTVVWRVNGPFYKLYFNTWVLNAPVLPASKDQLSWRLCQKGLKLIRLKRRVIYIQYVAFRGPRWDFLNGCGYKPCVFWRKLVIGH